MIFLLEQSWITHLLQVKPHHPRIRALRLVVERVKRRSQVTEPIESKNRIKISCFSILFNRLNAIQGRTVLRAMERPAKIHPEQNVARHHMMNVCFFYKFDVE